MNLSIKILFTLLITPILLLAENKPKEVVKNLIDKQEQIVTLIENYFMSGNNVKLDSTTNKYFIDRKELSKYYNLKPEFFNNLSNEKCVLDSTTYCSNNGGIEFELEEKDNYYTGVRFKDSTTFGTSCNYCNNIFFKNFYKNVISGSRIKINENINDGIPDNDSVFYPLKRNISDLFIKTDIYYDMYGTNLHIGESAPTNKSQVWVDIRGVKAIERYWFSNSNKWLEKTSSNNITYLTSKKELSNVPKIDGTKVIILSENGFSTTYSYNLEYETKCQTTNTYDTTTYDQYCGWIKVIKGMDDFDFVINGVDLTNKTN